MLKYVVDLLRSELGIYEVLNAGEGKGTKHSTVIIFKELSKKILIL